MMNDDRDKEVACHNAFQYIPSLIHKTLTRYLY